MEEDQSFEIIGEVDDKDEKIKQLKEKLKETEKQLNELNRNLEQRVIERTVEVNRLLKHKIRFIDNLSHDLGTPLTPLISLLPMIKEEVKKIETKELIDTLIRNVEYIKRVIQNARELADISSTNLMFKEENLSQIIDELEKKYKPVFKGCNIKVKNNVSSDVIVKTERTRLLQLLDHITSNAVNSMLEGGSLIYDSKLDNSDKGPFIQISVTDSGVGLTREQSDRLFEEFYKTDDFGLIVMVQVLVLLFISLFLLKRVFLIGVSKEKEEFKY
jgi:signal transduction histidine kinase